MIKQADIVESYFGYWREFCDGRVTSFAYESPDLLLLGILYTDVEKARGAQVQLKFVGVSDVDLSELRSENVLDSLLLTEGNPKRALLEAAYGLAGSFNFERVEVVSLLPNKSIQPTCADTRG